MIHKPYSDSGIVHSCGGVVESAGWVNGLPKTELLRRMDVVKLRCTECGSLAELHWKRSKMPLFDETTWEKIGEQTVWSRELVEVSP